MVEKTRLRFTESLPERDILPNAKFISCLSREEKEKFNFFFQGKKINIERSVIANRLEQNGLIECRPRIR